MGPAPLPPCPPDGPVFGCCTVALPNASSWVVCASQEPPQVATVPTVSLGGLLVTSSLVAAVGATLVRRWR